MLTTLVEFSKMYGAPICLVFFFIWRDWKREKVMTARIKEIEDYQRNKLEGLIEKTTEALNDNTRVMETFIAKVGK